MFVSLPKIRKLKFGLPKEQYQQVGSFGCNCVMRVDLINRISAFLKWILERSPLKSFQCEDPQRSLQSATWKMALTRTQSRWHPDLRLPISRSVRNVSVIYKPSNQWYFVIAAQTNEDTGFLFLVLFLTSFYIRQVTQFSDP